MSEGRTGDGAAAKPRGAIVLLIVVGAVMLASGLAGLGPAAAAAYVGAVMFVWTVLLPRLSVLRPVGVFFAAHSFAAGAYWAALTFHEGAAILVGPPNQVRFSLGLTFFLAVLASASALGLGLGLDRAVRRGGAHIRRALGVATGILLVITPVLIVGVIGEAPTPIERLRAAPVVGQVAAGQRVARGALALFRTADGSFQPVASGNLEWLVARGPDAFSSTQDGDSVCRAIAADAPIEIRELSGRLIYTAEAAFEDPEVQSIAGCAYDSATLEQVVIRNSDLPRPLSASPKIFSIVFGALGVAAIQLMLAGFALARHARLARAREGVADGEGSVRLTEGSEVLCVSPKGPVLVDVARSETEQYRVNAIASGVLVATGTRAEADGAMHIATCTALVGAVGALLASALPLLATLVHGLVAPLG